MQAVGVRRIYALSTLNFVRSPNERPEVDDRLLFQDLNLARLRIVRRVYVTRAIPYLSLFFFFFFISPLNRLAFAHRRAARAHSSHSHTLAASNFDVKPPFSQARRRPARIGYDHPIRS